jgi:hypothetical protein
MREKSRQGGKRTKYFVEGCSKESCFKESCFKESRPNGVCSHESEMAAPRRMIFGLLRVEN